MSEYILAIDQGTTGTKVLVMDTHLNLVAENSNPFKQYFPSPGLVEHDLNQIWESVQLGINSVTSKIDTKKIIAIGITNQRETICFWEKKTVNPLARAIVWQDRRTTARCLELRKKGFENKIRQKTGLLLDPYFSGTKLEWALKNNQDLKDAQAAGTLAVGTIESFLLAKLTDGAVHATESSNASRTLLFNIKKNAWDPDLLKIFKVNSKILPEVKNTFGEFGKTKNVKNLPDGIPITGMIGDQQSALLGQACIKPGMAKCTYGTGAFLLVNIGNKPKQSRFKLLTTIAWVDQDGKATYAFEGSAFMAGATIQWLRDGLKIISEASEIEALANSVKGSEGVSFVPAFTGLGAPHWDPEARAMIAGLSRGTTCAHIAYAALEGIALQNVDLLQAMEKDLGSKIKVLSVDGGASKNNLLMQIQADLLGRKLRRPKITETTSLGAVFAAGLGAGIWNSLNDIEKVWTLDQEFESKISNSDRKPKLAAWNLALKRVRLKN